MASDKTPEPARTDRPLADTKWVVGSVIATGGVIATLLLALAGLVIQQNASVNQRIDDVRGEMNRRIDDLQEEIRELRALVIDALKPPDPTAD